MKRVSLNIGDRFNSFTVMGFSHMENHRSYYKYKCDCGTEKIISSAPVSAGRIKTCGCSKKELKLIGNIEKGQVLYKDHNDTYFIWAAMIFRCKHIDHSSSEYYFKKGIAVCERWKSFDNFFEDMGNRPSKFHSIDRIDGDKDYSIENCRWATSTEQNRNKPNNILLNYNDAVYVASELAEKLNIKYYHFMNNLIKFSAIYNYKILGSRRNLKTA